MKNQKPVKENPSIAAKKAPKTSTGAPGGKGETIGEKIQAEWIDRSTSSVSRSPTSLDSTNL